MWYKIYEPECVRDSMCFIDHMLVRMKFGYEDRGNQRQSREKVCH